MATATLRMKAVIGSVKKSVDSNGNPNFEEVSLQAVYSSDGRSANAQWCKWTPSISFSFVISNPDAFNKVLPGQFFFIDLIPTDKDSI